MSMLLPAPLTCSEEGRDPMWQCKHSRESNIMPESYPSSTAALASGMRRALNCISRAPGTLAFAAVARRTMEDCMPKLSPSMVWRLCTVEAAGPQTSPEGRRSRGWAREWPGLGQRSWPQEAALGGAVIPASLPCRIHWVQVWSDWVFWKTCGSNQHTGCWGSWRHSSKTLPKPPISLPGSLIQSTTGGPVKLGTASAEGGEGRADCLRQGALSL